MQWLQIVVEKFGCELYHFLCHHLPCNRMNVYTEIPSNHHP